MRDAFEVLCQESSFRGNRKELNFSEKESNLLSALKSTLDDLGAVLVRSVGQDDVVREVVILFYELNGEKFEVEWDIWLGYFVVGSVKIVEKIESELLNKIKKLEPSVKQ